MCNFWFQIYERMNKNIMTSQKDEKTSKFAHSLVFLYLVAMYKSVIFALNIPN